MTELYKKGDVVLVSFRGDHDGTYRRRPAVVVSNDYNNARLDDVLIVPLYGSASRPGDSSYYVKIEMASAEGKSGGLRLDSVIDCTSIATIPKTLLVNKIGQFPPETLTKIDECIKKSIDLKPPKDWVPVYQ